MAIRCMLAQGQPHVLMLAAALPLLAALRVGHLGQAQEPEKFIAGVPVYNYERSLAYELNGSALLEQGEARSGLGTEDWIIMLSVSVDSEEIRQICSRFQATVTCKRIGGTGVPFVEAHCSQESLAAFLVGFGRERVDFVEPDMQTWVIPDILEEQPVKVKAPTKRREVKVAAARPASWGLERIGAHQAELTGHGINIFIVDTGIRSSHREFRDRLTPVLDVSDDLGRGWQLHACQSGEVTCAQDTHGHGTHVAGTAGGSSFGVSPGASMHAVKALGSNGEGDMASLIAAVDYVTTKAARPAVITMSLTAKGQSWAEDRAIKKAVGSGIVVVVAAGNEDDDACSYSPASSSAAITVGATDTSDSRAPYSNKGRCVDIWAPGSDIDSAGHTSDYRSARMSGTSMAAPHVAGAAALILQAHPTWTPAEVRARLMADAERGVVKGLGANDQNLFLHVTSKAGQAAESQGACPAFAQSSLPDRAGDCTCPAGTMCYLGSSKTCRLADGRVSRNRFGVDCEGCECKEAGRQVEPARKCPAFARSPRPTGNGDCACPVGSRCYLNDSLACPSAQGQRSTGHFTHDCQGCQCYKF